MQHFLLRIEAQNLSSFIFDNDDLSTVRGAGMILLNVFRLLTGQPDGSNSASVGLFKPKKNDADPVKKYSWNHEGVDIQLSEVSVGASICVLDFKATTDQASALAKEIREWLSNHELLKHATFSVAFQEITDGFRNSNERLLAKVRNLQMRQLSLVPPDIQHSKEARFCDIDAIRPGTVDLNAEKASDTQSAFAKASDKNWVSQSSSVRRAYGRNAKVRIYGLVGEEQDSKAPFVPTWTFEELARRGKWRMDHVDDDDPYAKLDGKMAVLYFDGNAFGRLQANKVKELSDQREFDQAVREYRRGLMQALIQKIKSEPRWQVKPDAEVAKQFANKDGRELPYQGRLETLMWGGDELVWVLPAWCGFEAVNFFYEFSSGWEFAGQKLTHAGGLVFCSHKSPIREVVTLAKELAEGVKAKLVEIHRRAEPNSKTSDADVPYQSTSNAFAYQVLESFDSLGSDIEQARADRRFNQLDASDEVLTATSLKEIEVHIRSLKEKDFSQGRLYEIVRQIRSAPDELQTLFNRIVATNTAIAHSDLNDLVVGKTDAETKASVFVSQAAKWHHLVEAWNYVS